MPMNTEPQDHYSAASQIEQPKTVRSRKVVNPVKSKRPISAYRDAHFLRDLEGLSISPHMTASATSSVIYTHTTPFTPSPPSIDPARKAKGERGRLYGHWHRERYLPNPARSYRVPAQWRDTSDQLRVLYLHRALATLGTVHAFSLNLRDDIERLARSQDNACGWLHKRIARELNAQLGRDVTFFPVIEEAEGRLHVHGELLIEKSEAELARKALRRAGGEWVENRQHQTKTRLAPDEGWVSYIVKDFWKFGPVVRPLIANSRIFGTTISGPLFSSTDDLRKLAPALYDADRRKVYRFRYGRT